MASLGRMAARLGCIEPTVSRIVVQRPHQHAASLFPYDCCMLMSALCIFEECHASQGAYGASLGSVTALAKLQGDQAQSYKIALASSLAAAQSQPPTTDMSVANLQSFANAVPHGSNGVVLQQGQHV